jgi:alkylhydroperoxidase family enzyme
MNRKNTFALLAAVTIVLTLLASMGTVDAQTKKYKMTTDIPASITTPDVVETSLGTLRFFDGFPDEATVQKVYDNLDFQRGVQAFLTCIPPASAYALRTGIRSFGPDNQTVIISETLLDSRSLILTGNTETIYNTTWLSTKDGPLVIEMPAGVLGVIDDFWFRFVTDIGPLGPDKGNGGKFLLLPPDYKGEIPEGYFVLHSRTYGHWYFFRVFIEGGDMETAVEYSKKNYRAYPLALAANPPAMNFLNFSGESFNTVHSNNFLFFEEVNQVIQEEPLDAVDPEVRGQLAAIGIRKGKPFEPDSRMKSILTDAAAVGNATARANNFSTRDKEAYFYPNSAWKSVFVGNHHQFSPGGVLNLDARSMYFYMGTGSSPSWVEKMVGQLSQYIFTEHDAAGQYLDGGKSYRLHLSPNIPAKKFWSLVVYDPQTRSLLQTDHPFASISSLKEGITVNPDSSVDVWFGPEPPAGKEANWIQTVPGKGWFVMLRIYGPLEPWFDKTWRIGEIEMMTQSVNPSDLTNKVMPIQNANVMEKQETVKPETGARIQPRPMSEMRDEWVKILERLPGAGLKGLYTPVNVFGTLMYNPKTMGSFLDYWVTSKLEMGLTGREQELIILRMGFLFNCNYVWKHHIPPAREFGVNDSEIIAVKTKPLPPVFSARENALLMLTDEMLEYRTIRDEAWSQWSGELKSSELLDLVSIVSQYVFFALLNNSFQIEIEEPLKTIPGL